MRGLVIQKGEAFREKHSEGSIQGEASRGKHSGGFGKHPGDIYYTFFFIRTRVLSPTASWPKKK